MIIRFSKTKSHFNITQIPRPGLPKRKTQSKFWARHQVFCGGVCVFRQLGCIGQLTRTSIISLPGPAKDRSSTPGLRDLCFMAWFQEVAKFYTFISFQGVNRSIFYLVHGYSTHPQKGEWDVILYVEQLQYTLKRVNGMQFCMLSGYSTHTRKGEWDAILYAES